MVLMLQTKTEPTIWQEVLHLSIVALVTILSKEFVDERASRSVGWDHSQVGGRNHAPLRDVVIDIRYRQLHSDQVPVWTWGSKKSKKNVRKESSRHHSWRTKEAAEQHKGGKRG